MNIRPATPDDAEGMSAVLGAIIREWKSDRAYDPEHVRNYYIDHPDTVRCSVAVDEHDRVLGFQALIRAGEGNRYGVTPGWGIIGTYVDLNSGRKGVGSALFASSLEAAKTAGLPFIDATIGKDNPKGLGYYAAMGFEDYKDLPTASGKRFAVAGS